MTFPRISIINERYRKGISIHLPRKPHHHDMRNAHREHLLAVDRQKLKLAERGLWPRIQAAIWRQLHD